MPLFRLGLARGARLAGRTQAVRRVSPNLKSKFNPRTSRVACACARRDNPLSLTSYFFESSVQTSEICAKIPCSDLSSRQNRKVREITFRFCAMFAQNLKNYSSSSTRDFRKNSSNLAIASGAEETVIRSPRNFLAPANPRK